MRVKKCSRCGKDMMLDRSSHKRTCDSCLHPKFNCRECGRELDIPKGGKSRTCPACSTRIRKDYEMARLEKRRREKLKNTQVPIKEWSPRVADPDQDIGVKLSGNDPFLVLEHNNEDGFLPGAVFDKVAMTLMVSAGFVEGIRLKRVDKEYIVVDKKIKELSQ